MVHFGAISPFRCGMNAFLWIVFMSILMSVTTNLNTGWITALIWYVSGYNSIRMENNEMTNLWRCIPSLLCVTGLSWTCVPIMLMMVMADQGNGPPALLDFWLWIAKKQTKWSGELAFGVNDSNPILTVVEDVKITINELYCVLTFEKKLTLRPTVYSEFIRPNGVAPYAMALNGGGELTPSEVVAAEHDRVAWNRRMVMITLITLATCAMDLAIMMGLAGLVLFYGAMGLERDNTFVRDIKTPPMADGVYRLRKRWFLFSLGDSIGIVHRGIMHATYHGCGTSPLIMGKNEYEPFYGAISSDMITYGGLPQMDVPVNGDIMYVNRESEEMRVTLEVQWNWDSEMRAYTWIGNSVRGESGSPVWVVRNGHRVLVGLIGRWASVGDIQTEIMVCPPLQHMEKPEFGTVKKLVRHPGWGKTRKEVPNIVATYLFSTNKRIMIVGPTRIVALELYRSLRSTFASVGLSMKNEAGKRSPRSRIQITTHASFIRMLHAGALETTNIGCLIIDEAHVGDTSTKLCRMYGEELARNGGTTFELSATLDDNHDDGSNYPIEDKHLGKTTLRAAIRIAMDEKKRTLVFVSGKSGKDGVKELVNELKEYDPIGLYRESYSGVVNQLNDTSRRLIITTNIAECGLNIDCDVVIDTGLEFDYFATDDIIEGEVVPIDKASQIQRRGRCGRTRPGEYWHWEQKERGDRTRACDYEAKILASGRKWYSGDTGSRFVVSDAQFAICVERGYNPRYVATLYDRNGKPYGDNTRNANITSWACGTAIKMPCICKQCGGSYSWFDERHHAELMEWKRGEKKGMGRRNALVEI